MTMHSDGYFSIEKDIAIIEAGGFFCLGCLTGKPSSEQSADPRYCLGCYGFLLKEAESSLPLGQRPAWIPRYTPSSDAVVSPQAVDKNHTPALIGSAIMSTLGSIRNTGDIIPPTNATRANGRGRRHKVLPVELITQWAGEGMGSKVIASRLNEQGIQVSYKTIQRVLSGARKISS